MSEKIEKALSLSSNDMRFRIYHIEEDQYLIEEDKFYTQHVLRSGSGVLLFKNIAAVEIGTVFVESEDLINNPSYIIETLQYIEERLKDEHVLDKVKYEMIIRLRTHEMNKITTENIEPLVKKFQAAEDQLLEKYGSVEVCPVGYGRFKNQRNDKITLLISGSINTLIES